LFCRGPPQHGSHLRVRECACSAGAMASSSVSPLAALLLDAPGRLAALQGLLPRLGVDSVLVAAEFFGDTAEETIGEILGSGAPFTADEAEYIDLIVGFASGGG